MCSPSCRLTLPGLGREQLLANPLRTDIAASLMSHRTIGTILSVVNGLPEGCLCAQNIETHGDIKQASDSLEIVTIFNALGLWRSPVKIGKCYKPLHNLRHQP